MAENISGRVSDENGDGIQGVTVTAVPHNESVDIFRTETDENGDFIFDSLVSGYYHVYCRSSSIDSPEYQKWGHKSYPFVEV